jgi:16S rRNA (adenine1518-N6/adenine1519-N6)-dimethyltransferase
MTKRRLGQHFLSDPTILRRIVAAAELQQEDLVVEIGPGPGKLTRILAENAKRVIAIELDENLHRSLRDEMHPQENVEIVQGDALEYPYEDLPEFKVVANIPYYITTPILFRLLSNKVSLKTMTLTVQREVAERIVAKPGGKDYGVLSLMLQYRGTPELKFIIPKQAFRPVPRVDSAVIHISLLAKPPVTVFAEDIFFIIIKTAFSQRRKMLSNSLKSLGKNVKEWFDRAHIDPSRRPETLSLEEFARLANTFGLL